MKDIAKRLGPKPDERGFTLIELLVVVVIIGVLVAIAVPVYLNYRQGAADKSAQSDARAAISAMEQYYTDNGNSYGTGVAATTTSPISLDASHKINLSTGTKLAVIVTAGAYKICSNNTGGTKYYVYDSSNGQWTTPASVTWTTC
jgi:type IV pilus assembly protein PilA